MGQHGFFEEEERHPRTAREERISRAKDKEHVRLALGSTARHGYYIFDELITENSGLIDFLVVGSMGVIVVVLRFDAGHISRGASQEQALIDGKAFEDDPYSQGQELSEEVDEAVFNGLGEVYSIACFPRCEFELDEERKPPLGTTPVWELPLALDPEGKEEGLTPADIEEIAEKVQEVYGRPPIATPQRDEDERGD